MTDVALKPVVVEIVKQGPQGPAIGDIRGAWSAGVYPRRAIVEHIGSLWLSLRQTVGEPGSSADWQLLVSGETVAADELREDMSSSSDPEKGAGAVGFDESAGYAASSAGAALQGRIKKAGDTVFGRLRFQGYVPEFNLGNSMVEGGGTSLSVEMPFDMGDITLPSGADKQHVGIRFRGTFRCTDAFETAGVSGIVFNLDSYNCDLYAVRSSLTLRSGDKEIKALYGRATNASIDNAGVVVGGVFGVGNAAGVNGGTAWAVQLDYSGDGEASNSALISSGSNTPGGKNATYGFFSSPSLGFTNAFIRAFARGAGQFLRWDVPNAGGPNVHVTAFSVTAKGEVSVSPIDGAINPLTINYSNSPDTEGNANARAGIVLSSSSEKRLAHGLYAGTQITFGNAFARAFGEDTGGRFLWFQQANGGGPDVHVDKFVVDSYGQVRGKSFSIGRPTYSFIDDADTGMYSPGANQIGFSVGSAVALSLRAPPGDGNTSVIISVNKMGVVSSKSVFVGAADSAGAGYSVLRVAN